MKARKLMPVLSIVIPTFNRSSKLSFALDSIANQIVLLTDIEIELIVVDDCSTDDTKQVVEGYIQRFSFMQYVRNKENIGLERNLIESGKASRGRYLWIFGDDDYLETKDSLKIVVDELLLDKYSLIVVNRSRRNADLSKLISKNWMGFNPKKRKVYKGLIDFCYEWGLISVIGFITVNIFRRKEFFEAENEQFFGTMYPQLGMMVSAFYSSPCLLIGEPLICHRTQTVEEKQKEFKSKEKEKYFMTNVELRNAKYFSFPFVRMLSQLVSTNAIEYQDIDKIQENTVINGFLTEFLVSNIDLSVNLGLVITDEDWAIANNLFKNLSLTQSQKESLVMYKGIDAFDYLLPKIDRNRPSISVITPSFNQAQFLPECLQSVFSQTYPPIEHLVFDPGSMDGSREIAINYKYVKLIAEADDGQGDAVARGIKMAKGDIIAWINSDDLYYDAKVFERIVDRFLGNDAPDIVYGRGIYIDNDGNKQREAYVNPNPDTLSWRFQQEDGILQPSLFFKREITQKVGNVSADLEFCMDYEYWIRCIKSDLNFVYLDSLLSKAHYHSDNKTFGQRGSSYGQVCDMLYGQYAYVNHAWLKRYAEYNAEGLDGVLAHAQNTKNISKEKIQLEYIKLLKAYNLNADTITKLEEHASEKGYGETLRELKSYKYLFDRPYKLIAMDDEVKAAQYYAYVVGRRRWAYAADWKDKQIEKSHRFLSAMKKSRASDTCVIVCNGPTLNKVEYEILDGYDLIASNNIFLKEEILSRVKYYTVVNYLVAEQSAPQINLIGNSYKIIPIWLRYCINDDRNTYFVDAVGRPEFSTNIFKNISWRHTVTFYNLQLAYGLGYKKVVLIGCDHHYKQPTGINEGETIHDNIDDSNHFNSHYFKNKKWQAADVDMMEEMYKLAKDAYEKEGREIVNCTEGGHLELFRRSPLNVELPKLLNMNMKYAEYNKCPLYGPYDREHGAWLDETDVICKYIGDKYQGLMIDVGAHHGHASKPFLDKNWKVFAFEPDPDNRKILIQRYGAHSGISIFDYAVSNVAGDAVPFYASNESSGISGLSAFRDGHKEICSVQTIVLSDFCENQHIIEINFLKIDTEGFDLMVLEGVPWGKITPEIIECEFEDVKSEKLDYTFHDLAQYLMDKGYYVYVSEWHPIIRYGIRHQWNRLTRYPCELSNNKCWGNLLAFREPIDEDELVAHLKNVMKLKVSMMIKGHLFKGIINNNIVKLKYHIIVLSRKSVVVAKIVSLLRLLKRRLNLYL